MTPQSKGWSMNLSPGATSSCWSIALQRVASNRPAHQRRMPFVRRRPDAYGALVFLARQTFVDPHRVAAVGFSAGAWVTLSVAEPNRSNSSSLRQLAVPGGGCVLSAMQAAAARPGIPTLIFIGALDDWTPAADCSNKVAGWGNDGPPVELVVYPGAHHGFYYRHLQPGKTCLITGWNTTARQQTMQVTACGSFSIATSTEGMSIAVSRTGLSVRGSASAFDRGRMPSLVPTSADGPGTRKHWRGSNILL